MKEFRRLLVDYGDQYSRATIYVIFTIVSLIVAVVLFGILQSIGIMKLAFPSYVQEATFGGAFAGFLATLIFLILMFKTPDELYVHGNVQYRNGKSVEKAKISIIGRDGFDYTDETGYFRIQVKDGKSWVVKAELEDVITEKEVKRSDIRQPIRLTFDEIELPAIPAADGVIEATQKPEGGPRPEKAPEQTLQREDKDVIPESEPSVSQGFNKNTSVDKRKLRDGMVQAFSVEELNSLCLDVQEKLAEKDISLKVNLDIVGGTSKEGKIINLITYLDNRGFLVLLVEAVKEERPNLL